MLSNTKCAFVTGGSRGIGAGICQVLAEEGYDVAFTYATAADEAQMVYDEIVALGRRCFFYQASLEQPDVPEAVTARAISDLGSIDLLVNNAGLTRHHKIMEATVEQYDFVYGLNYRAPLLCAKVAANYMVKHGIKGNIINISSSRSQRAYPTDPAYGGLKAALNRSTETMALQLAKYGIRANVIAPGLTATRGEYVKDGQLEGWPTKIPLGRAGTPREIGYAAAFLASEKAAYITGIVLRIDGGLILPGMPEGNDPKFGVSWGNLE